MTKLLIKRTVSKAPKEYKITKKFVDCILASIDNPEPDSDDETAPEQDKMDTR